MLSLLTQLLQPNTYPGCVINMSFNTHDVDYRILKALNRARDAGILATVTAGNTRQPSTQPLCR